MGRMDKDRWKQTVYTAEDRSIPLLNRYLHSAIPFSA
jgi:hypothetical protein